MKDWSPNSKTKWSKLLTTHLELAPLCFYQSFCCLGLSTVCCFFSATEAVQVNPGASFLERALGVSAFWSLQHGTSKNHRILEAQDPVSSNIDPKQRTLKQYVADTCHAADLLL